VTADNGLQHVRTLTFLINEYEGLTGYQVAVTGVVSNPHNVFKSDGTSAGNFTVPYYDFGGAVSLEIRLSGVLSTVAVDPSSTLAGDIVAPVTVGDPYTVQLTMGARGTAETFDFTVTSDDPLAPTSTRVLTFTIPKNTIETFTIDVSGPTYGSWDQDTVAADLASNVPYDKAGQLITITIAAPKFCALTQQGGDAVELSFTTSNSDAGQYIATFNAAARVSCAAARLCDSTRVLDQGQARQLELLVAVFQCPSMSCSFFSVTVSLLPGL
jgi:hypothetical protein